MRTMISTLVVVAGIGAASSASAQLPGWPEPAWSDEPPKDAPPEPPPLPTSPGKIELSLKAGGHFPQVTNRLGTNLDGILKLGLGVAMDDHLQLFTELGYSQPSHTSSASDPRVAGGAPWTSTLTVRDVTATLGLTYFLRVGSPTFLPYVGAGGQLHHVSSRVTGGQGKGAPFGDHTETAMRPGGVAFAGTGLRLGPGVLLGELRFAYAPIDQKVTGTANIGALSALLGYGLMF